MRSAAVRDLRSEHSMPPSCRPHERSPDTRAYSRLAHGIRPRGRARSLRLGERDARGTSRFLSALRRCEKNEPEGGGMADEQGSRGGYPFHERLTKNHGFLAQPTGASGIIGGRRARKAAKGDTRAMHSTAEHDQTKHPLVRITTLGEFALERLVRTPSRAEDEPPRYARMAQSEWSNRGPAMALLKVLLCRANRRASREELIEAIWPDHEAINAAHALDSAASVLRRHILRTGAVGSLLLTLRSGGDTIFKLAGQQRIWVDADALLSLVSQAMRAECRGQNPIPLLEEAHALVRGEFLEDDLYAEWAQPRRHTLNGARHRVLFKLVDLYLSGERVGVAEGLLFAALEEDPADEDALCRLMVLLVEQQRRQEALQLYQYTEDVLQEEQTEPAVYTHELARRIRQGLLLRERGEGYTVAGVQTLFLVGRDAVSRDYGDSFGVKGPRMAITAAPCRGQMPSSYRYCPPRRRSRKQAALSVG